MRRSGPRGTGNLSTGHQPARSILAILLGYPGNVSSYDGVLHGQGVWNRAIVNVVRSSEVQSPQSRDGRGQVGPAQTSSTLLSAPPPRRPDLNATRRRDSCNICRTSLTVPRPHLSELVSPALPGGPERRGGAGAGWLVGCSDVSRNDRGICACHGYWSGMTKRPKRASRQAVPSSPNPSIAGQGVGAAEV